MSWQDDIPDNVIVSLVRQQEIESRWEARIKQILMRFLLLLLMVLCVLWWNW